MKHKFVIFSDYVWPYCYIGKGIVDKLKKEFDIDDEWLPFEIHTETPTNGMAIGNLFPPSSLESMFRNLKLMGEKYGIEFNIINILSNTHLSLAAGEYAKEMGKFHEYNQEIFNAYFSKGRDIGDINVILSIAESIGLNSMELQRKLSDGQYDGILRNTTEEAKRSRINSTPTFIIDDKYIIVGAQPIEKFRDVLRKTEDI